MRNQEQYIIKRWVGYISKSSFIITPNQKVIFFEFSWPAGQQLFLFCNTIRKSLNFTISFQDYDGNTGCTMCTCDTDDCNGASMSQISTVGCIAVLLLSFMNQ